MQLQRAAERRWEDAPVSSAETALCVSSVRARRSRIVAPVFSDMRYDMWVYARGPATAPTAVGAQASDDGALTSVPPDSSVWRLFESVVLGQGATLMIA